MRQEETPSLHDRSITHYYTWHINLKVINKKPIGLGWRWSIAMDNDCDLKFDHFQIFVIYINLPMWTNQLSQSTQVDNIHCSCKLPNMRLEFYYFNKSRHVMLINVKKAIYWSKKFWWFCIHHNEMEINEDEASTSLPLC